MRFFLLIFHYFQHIKHSNKITLLTNRHKSRARRHTLFSLQLTRCTEFTCNKSEAYVRFNVGCNFSQAPKNMLRFFSKLQNKRNIWMLITTTTLYWQMNEQVLKFLVILAIVWAWQIFRMLRNYPITLWIAN